MKIKERFYLASVVLTAVLAFLLVRNRTASNESLFAQRQTVESKSSYYEYTGPMEQSSNDHRQHRLIRLPNGMSALCTYDPQAESAAASLAVNVASLSDPPSFLGMAHFLEHMLFMGSEHPFSLFDMGNLETLKAAANQANVSLADEVRKFYDTYYSASIMKLAVVGNHTLDQLTEWAVSMFSAVKDKGDTSIKLDSHPVGPNELGKVIFYETLEDSNIITLEFPVPNTESKYRQLPNVFIPENLQMSDTSSIDTDSDSSNKHPELLRLSDKLELWFKQDTQFHTPHGAVYITIEPKHLPSTPLESVLGSIYSMCMDSVLTKELYGVETGGMKYFAWASESSLDIGVGGFKEKMPLLLDMIMHRITNFELKREDYEMYRLKLEKSFSQYQYSDARRNAMMWHSLVTNSPAYHYKEREHALLNSVTFEKTQEYIAGLLNHTFVKMLVSGQFTETEALEISDNVVNTIGSAHLEKEQMHNVYTVDISPGSYMYSFVMSDEGAENGGVASIVYCGEGGDLNDTIALMVIDSMLNNLFFEGVRTKEQLGYAVSATLKESSDGYSSVQFLLQGEHNPMYAKLRIDNFIRGFRGKLEEMSDDSIQEKIGALSKSLLEKHKSIGEEALSDWDVIEGGWYNFDSNHKLVKKLRLVTKEDILGAWDRSINPTTAAENYTRIDYYAWPQKMWSPQSEDLVKYPETIIALYGCLKYDGIASGELADVAEAVALIQAGIELPESDTDSLASRLHQLYNDSNSTLNSKTALEMAIEHIENDKRQTDTTTRYESQNDYHEIGMRKTPEGTWMISDIDTFKAANGLHPLPEPIEELVPKYSGV
ncbi:metalloprotease [Coemansia sp. RSA 1285]|nr:metalloprotease [Coemansia sp. RSA 1285]